MDDGLAHITSVQSSCNPEKAFHCLSDLNQIPEWNFNLAGVGMVERHLAEGILKLNGESILIRVSMEEEMKIIHFHLGNSKDSLVPRIMIRVLPYPFSGKTGSGSLISMIAWRTEEMDDERWRALKAAHEYEILQIKAMLESKEK